MKKMLIVATMGVLMTAGLVGQASARNFSDEGRFQSWYSDSANKMFSKGIIKGFADGSFGGDKTVTRAELAVMLDRLIAMLETMRDKNHDGKDNSDGEMVACTMEFRYGLTVYLQDENGNPISDATVTATQNGKDVNDFNSSMNGQYSGLGEGKGYYNVTIQKTGFAPHRETVKLEKDECHVLPQIRTITLMSSTL